MLSWSLLILNGEKPWRRVLEAVGKEAFMSGLEQVSGSVGWVGTVQVDEIERLVLFFPLLRTNLRGDCRISHSLASLFWASRRSERTSLFRCVLSGAMTQTLGLLRCTSFLYLPRPCLPPPLSPLLLPLPSLAFQMVRLMSSDLELLREEGILDHILTQLRRVAIRAREAGAEESSQPWDARSPMAQHMAESEGGPSGVKLKRMLSSSDDGLDSASLILTPPAGGPERSRSEVEAEPQAVEVGKEGSAPESSSSGSGGRKAAAAAYWSNLDAVYKQCRSLFQVRGQELAFS